jgi:HD-GYP domain-containing protein (c-di-GMP phosphodiesterase class II)
LFTQLPFQDVEEQVDSATNLTDDAMMPPPDNNNNNNNNDDGWWEKTTADILKETDSIYCENLQNFQEHGVDRRAAVRDRLSFVMEDIKTKLDEITERTTNVLAAQLYDNYASNIQAQEHKILQLVRSNHASRVHMVEALEKANLNWESKYSNLMNRVIYATDNKSEESSMDNPKDGGAADSPSDSMKTLDGNAYSHDKKKSSSDSPSDSMKTLDGNANSHDKKESPSPVVATKDDSLNSESQDPDWDEVIRFAPHCEENIRSFLEVREKWKAVESRYIQAIESSHERLQANIMKTIHTVYETFQGFDERMDEQQYDIQKLMANNFERRQRLQQALEESANQAKSLFARLMARVSSIRAPGTHS